MTAPAFDYRARRAELEAELEAVVTELTLLRATLKTRQTAAEDGRWRYRLFVQRFAGATRHGADEASPGLLQLLHDERQARDLVNGRAERARRDVLNAQWKISCLRSDLEQLDRLEHPPPLAHRPEIVKRPKPTLDNYDPIIMPLGITGRA